ncbi:MAG: hypothetical protein Q8P81_03950 [Nanoarchaeota archaeon]|nr:hypothetical protein [Nanoarchaeota archaeon]
MSLMKSLVASALLVGCSGNSVVNSEPEEPVRVIENESYRDGDEFNFSHYTEALRYIMRNASQGVPREDTLLPKVYLPDVYLPDNRRKSDRFSFNLSKANSSIGDVERFIDVYYNEWETTLPESSGYHGRGDGGWYNIGWGSEGIEFFVRNGGGFIGLANNKEIRNLEEVELAISEVNDKFADYLQVLPLVVEKERGENLPEEDSKLSVDGYWVKANYAEMVNGDLIWIQDALREEGLEITLNHPNCNAFTIEGWDSIEAYKRAHTLLQWNRYWSREEKTERGLEFRVLPPLGWQIPRPDNQ